MTAFRYDIKIRMNTFAFRVSENGILAPPDISQRREDIAAMCFAEARRLNEGSFTDNPYAKGGVRFGFDWTTGLPRSNSNGSNFASLNHTNTQSSNVPDGQYAGTSGKRSHGQIENLSNGFRPKTGYNGKNFDPNYAAKKAVSAAGKQGTGGGST